MESNKDLSISIPKGFGLANPKMVKGPPEMLKKAAPEKSAEEKIIPPSGEQTEKNVTEISKTATGKTEQTETKMTTVKQIEAVTKQYADDIRLRTTPPAERISTRQPQIYGESKQQFPSIGLSQIDQNLKHTQIDQNLKHTQIDQNLKHTQIDQNLKHTQIDQNLKHTHETYQLSKSLNPRVELPELVGVRSDDMPSFGMNNEIIGQRKSYNMTAAISQHNNTKKIPARALVSGIVESVQMQQQTSPDQTMYAYPVPEIGGLYSAYSGRSQPVGLVASPPVPIRLLDRNPQPAPFVRSEIRDPMWGGLAAREPQGNQRKLQPSRQIVRPPYQVHCQDITRSSCPTCGVPSQSEFSRFRLPPATSLPVDKNLPYKQYETKQSKTWIDQRQRQESEFDPPFAEPPRDTPVGYSKWRNIERQLNESRAAIPHRGRKEETDSDVSSGVPTPRTYKPGPKYRESQNWKEEGSNDLQMKRRKLNDKENRKRSYPKSQGRKEFEGGLTTYRRNPYRSLSEMATYYAQLEVEDQADVISLLLACRKLEKQIEEQHVVIDMLDHDLLQAQQTLQFPPEWQKMRGIDLAGAPPPPTTSLPDGNLPLYLKGRVLLQQKEPPPGATFIIEPDMATAVRVTPQEPPSVAEKGKPMLKDHTAGVTATKAASAASSTKARQGLPIMSKTEGAPGVTPKPPTITVQAPTKKELGKTELRPKTEKAEAAKISGVQAAVAPKAADAPKPVEGSKAPDVPKPTGAPKAADVPKPTDAPKAADVAKPEGVPKGTDAPKSDEVSKAKADEVSNAAVKPPPKGPPDAPVAAPLGKPTAKGPPPPPKPKPK